MCQSVGREARQANTSDKPERVPYIGDDRKAELSASCQVRAGNRKPEATEATRTHLGARKPAPGKANGKRKGDLGPKADSSRLMPSGLSIHLATTAKLQIQPPLSRQSCGGDRETEYDPPVAPVRSWRAVVGSEWSTNPTGDSDQTEPRLCTHRRLAV